MADFPLLSFLFFKSTIQFICQVGEDSSMERLEIYCELLWIYYEYTLQVLESNTMSEVEE